jgi:hypothetical protein
MFGKKKLPVLTDTTCSEINLIVKIVEVLTGKQSRMKRFDFNTGRGQVYLGNEVQNFFFRLIDGDLSVGSRFEFATILSEDPQHYTEYTSYTVHLEEGGEVRIGTISERVLHQMRNGMPLWWVGDSASNRREEPYWK